LNNEFFEILLSPTSGRPLTRLTPHILSDGLNQWPCIDGIPYLRVNRLALIDSALSEIRNNNILEALAILLTDRKDSSIPPADIQSARKVAEGNETFQDAMQGLNYGGMIPYIRHRWCQPSFLSGLALMELGLNKEDRIFEVACGVGHYLREWNNRGGEGIGGDIVFSSLWLAKKYMVPNGNFVCFDANERFPFKSNSASISLSMDSFHYFAAKENVIAELKRISSGRVLLGHVHNSLQQNFSPGFPLSGQEYLDLIHPDFIYDDESLTLFALTNNEETLKTTTDTITPSALAFVCGEIPINPAAGLTTAQTGKQLVLNPLLGSHGPVWPNKKFENEYVNRWSYLKDMQYPEEEVIRAALKGLVGINQDVSQLARKRVFLDIPIELI
jgi:SAM-dependent methyltransferase